MHRYAETVRRLALVLAPAIGLGATLAAAPANAQTKAQTEAQTEAQAGTQPEEPRFDMDELKRQLDEAWEEMMRELGPTIEGFGALLETLDRVDSLENYERPEILPNGDIVIRRKPGAPPLPEPPEEPVVPPPAAPGPGIRT